MHPTSSKKPPGQAAFEHSFPNLKVDPKEPKEKSKYQPRAELENIIKINETSLAALNKKLESREEHISVLSQDIANKELEISHLTKQLQVITEENKEHSESLRSQIKNLSTELGEKIVECATLKEEKEKLALLALHGQNESVVSLTKAIENKEVEIAGLKTQIEEATKEKKQHVDILGIQLKNLEDQLKANKEMREEIESQNAITIKTQREEILKLNLRVRELETELKTPKKTEQIVRPTANDLSTKLTNLNPIIDEVNLLQTKIGKLRDDAQTTCEMIKQKKATIPILEKALDDLDPEMDTLVVKYVDLNPRVLDALANLAKSIDEATHEPIPLRHTKAISAKNYIPLDVMQTNDTTFETLLKKCQETFDTLSTKLNHIKRRYDDATAHLNCIDHNLGVLKNPDTWALVAVRHWGDKYRNSPTTLPFPEKAAEPYVA